MDLNHRPPGPEKESQNLISAAPGVAYGITDHLFPLLNWTDVGPKFWGEPLGWRNMHRFHLG